MIRSPDSRLAGKRILAIDDDPMTLDMIRLMLQNAGATCETADSGPEGLTRMESFQPHMILLDYMMPVMNGAQVYEAIQTRDEFRSYRSLPVLMLTGKTDNADEQQTFFRMGLDAYLHKPFGFRELINVISNVFALRDARQENAQLHEEIRQVRNYLQSIFDHITDIVSVQDASFAIQRHNRTATRWSDGSPLEGRRCYRMYFGRDAVCEGCPVPSMLETGRAATSELPSSDDRSYEVSVYPIHSSGGQLTTFVEIIRDTTERRRLEQRLLESSKLASLGTLAAGVAHEINNPLCIILGFAQSLAQDHTLPESVRRDLTIIEQESARCGKILQDLLSYAKPSTAEKTAVHLADVLTSCIELLQQMSKKNGVEVRTEYESSLPFLHVDVPKLQQVFINILLNSLQAMPTGGRLFVAMRLDRPQRTITTTITDTGSGIPSDRIERIFDPFFTTKFGSGTGLGLAISRAIVNEHGGTISATSAEGQGTTVTVVLPIDAKIL